MTQTPRDALTDLLVDLPMPAITRHWVEEYLRDLVDKGDIETLQQQVHDLEEEVWELEQDKSHLEDDVYDLEQRNQELEAGRNEYAPGVN